MQILKAALVATGIGFGIFFMYFYVPFIIAWLQR